MNSYLETALPLAEINQAAIREKAGKRGHPANLHMWWGRSPEASSLASLAAAVMDYKEDAASGDLELLAKTASGDPEALEALRERLREQGELPVVWDPFSGFGGIPIAAQKLGLKAAANDLNPVAATLTRAAADIPARFAAQPPVHPGAPERASCSGAEGLAEDVRFYGNWMEQQALKRLSALYPRTEEGGIPFAWVWVRTVKCSNPACQGTVPLGSSYVLDRAKTSQHWVEPVAENGALRFVIHEGICPSERESNKAGTGGARFRCPHCGGITTDAYIKKTGEAHGLGAEMMAVVTTAGRKKSYLVPDEVQKAAAGVERPEEVPRGTIPKNPRWFSPPGFGLTEFADLFTPRQLRMLTVFSDLVGEAQNMAASAALAAGMSAAGGTLEDGGTGALAYGQAVGVYLALTVDKLADYNSSMCSWRTAGGNVRSTFGRQAIPMSWTFAEGNPFSDVSGNYQSMLNSVARSLECLGLGAPVRVSQEDAVTMEHPREVLVCTELPYYRDIGYADLSGFFYIWLRRSLKGTWPQMFAPMVPPKEELSALPSCYGTAAEEAEERYRAGLKAVCEKLYGCASERVPALFFYCFRKSDLASVRQGHTGPRPSPWEHMLECLLSAGFGVSAVWPMRSEPVSERADSTRVLIAATKGAKRLGPVTRRGFITALKRELPERLRRLWTGRIPAEDAELSCMGQGLAVFSAYESVLNADGSPMTVHDALGIIDQACGDWIRQRTEAASDGAAGSESEPKEE